MSRIIDLTHQRFGRLVVEARAAEAAPNGNAQWVCRCDCGNRTVVDSYSLRKGTTKSCGCLRREVSHKFAKCNQAFIDSQGTSLKNKDGIGYCSLIKGKRNRTGVIGVSFDEQSHRFVARLMFHGKYVLNKTTATFGEAVELRKEAEAVYFKHSERKSS